MWRRCKRVATAAAFIQRKRELLPWFYNYLDHDINIIGRKRNAHDNYNDSKSEFYIKKTREVILSNTEITRAHLTPEIPLHLLTPNCFLYNSPVPLSESNPIKLQWMQDYDDESSKYYPTVTNIFKEPFWSIYWPGGQALARFVLDHGDNLFSNETFNLQNDAVLDLGTGCGAVAIAAKLRGAKNVLANDIDPVACVAVDMNADLNNIRLKTSRDNLLARPYGTVQGAESFQIIFVGDLFYDEEIARLLISWLDQAVCQGAKIYLGDPGRHGLTNQLRKRLGKIQNYPLPDNVQKENYGFDSATVWQFLKP